MADRRRRKSLSIFRPTLTGLTPIHDSQNSPDSAPATLLKKRRTETATTPDPPSPSPSASSTTKLERTSSRTSLLGKSRPRSLQKSRPSSIFGSFRSLHSLQSEDENNATNIPSTPTSLHSDGIAEYDITESSVIHHGDVQMAGGMFRKKSQYLVLTGQHLVRFKSRTRASEVFPSIPSSLSRKDAMRHSRMSSSGSLHELHPTSSAESFHSLPLNHIVAVYKLDDGRPYFSIEVAFLEDDHPAAMTLQIADPQESELWLSCLRSATEKVRVSDPLPFSPKLIEYTARALEQERDYDPQHFHMFRVVQRGSKSGSRSSSDDLAKLTTNICVLAVGMYKVHLIPYPKSTRTASNASLIDMLGCSFGVVTLTSLSIQTFDDTIQLHFRMPLRQQTSLFLASSAATEVAIWIRNTADYLRPEWLEQSFTWDVPPTVDDEMFPVSSENEDHRCFDRTLTAYCAAYGLDTSNIRYTVNYQCEDAPGFELLPAADPKSVKYNVLELLAVIRSLRYNESFHSVSFRNISLDAMHGLSDFFGADHVVWTSKSGEPLKMPHPKDSWLLVQEIQMLALKSKKLRRMDFTNCVTRKPVDGDDVRDVGCGICEALFPLCARQLTNVDWITLNGITLADADIDYLYAAAIDKLCHFRALELGNCGLGDRSLQTSLHAMSHQDSTMESIDLSNNPARLDPEFLQSQLSAFDFIRKLNLSNVNRKSGTEPLLTGNVLLAWKLEELRLDNIALNEADLKVLSAYLKSSQSETLRLLGLNQCNLTGGGVADLLHSMYRGVANVRPIHLHITKNKLEESHDRFVAAVSRSVTPCGITMQMLEYKREQNFQNFIIALTNNTSLRYLDISKASLPYDADEDSCAALQAMFAQNRTLEELDISGEQAHLEVASLGIGLNRALLGLKQNESLRVLRIENQGLGLQGANTLASVLEENRGLQEVHCDNNDISLQAFTVLVRSLEQNFTLLYLPEMVDDRSKSLYKVIREVDSAREANSIMNLAIPGKATVKRTMGAVMTSQRSSNRTIARPRVAPMPSLATKDAQAAVSMLEANWDREVSRLQDYLLRNYDIAHDLPPEGTKTSPKDCDDEDVDRPTTADTSITAVPTTSMQATPTCEADLRLGESMTAPDAEAQEGPSFASEPEDESSSDIADDADDVEGALMMGEKLHI
ncbi:MAG: hypothetical protein Q9191_005474 [Dirinaria sp. TL-2023a]